MTAFPQTHFNAPDVRSTPRKTATIGSEATMSIAVATCSNEVRPTRWPVWKPLLAALFFSVMIRVFDIDRKVSSFGYDTRQQSWPFERAEPWLSYYRYGIYPPMAVGLAGGLVLIVGLVRQWRRPNNAPRRLGFISRNGFFLALMLLVGPGLLINGVFKTFWGRPRPIQCTDFGGEMTFLPVGEWASSPFPNSSFPSGHASVAFFLMGIGFVISPCRVHLQRVCFCLILW